MASAKLQQLVLFSSPWKIDIDSPLFACYHKPSKASRKRSKLPQAQTLCYVKSQALYGLEDSFKRLRWIGMLFHAPEALWNTLRHLASDLRAFMVFKFSSRSSCATSRHHYVREKTSEENDQILRFKPSIWEDVVLVSLTSTTDDCNMLLWSHRFGEVWPLPPGMVPKELWKAKLIPAESVVWDGLNLYGFAIAKRAQWEVVVVEWDF